MQVKMKVTNPSPLTGTLMLALLNLGFFLLGATFVLDRFPLGLEVSMLLQMIVCPLLAVLTLLHAYQDLMEHRDTVQAGLSVLISLVPLVYAFFVPIIEF